MNFVKLNETTTIKQGDTKRTFTALLHDENNVATNLTNATVTFILANRKDAVINKPATIVSAAGGEVSFSFDNDDVTGTGYLDGELRVTYTGGVQESFPTNGYMKIRVEPNLLSRGETNISPTLIEQYQQTIDGQSALIQENSNKVDVLSSEKISKTTVDVLKIYVDPVNGSDSNEGTQASKLKTLSKAWDKIPNGATNEIEILLAAGTFTQQNGTDEWGRPVLFSFYEKFINAKRDPSKAINTKGAKVRIKGAGKGVTILDGAAISARIGIYGHNVKNIYIEELTIKGCNTGILAHEGGDITCLNVEVKDNVNGLSIESQARIEIGYSSIVNNSYNVYMKNGQLQMNNSNVDDAIENNFKVEGSSYIITDSVTSKTLANKTCIDAKGAGYWDMKVCDFSGASGSVFLKGSVQHMQISQDTHIHDFGSNVFAPVSGFIHCISSHFWNNGFVIYATEGNALVKMDSCNSKNKSNVDTPNTQSTPIRFNCSGTLQITGTTVLPYKVLYSPPNDSPILYGSAPPTTGYHFKGKVMFNTAVTSGQPVGWQCKTAGEPGAWSAMPNLT